MASLKSQILQVLRIAGKVAKPPASYILGLAAVAIERWLPDSVPAVALAAPDDAKKIISDLFNAAVEFIPSPLARRLVRAAGEVVLARYVDLVWDYVTGAATESVFASSADPVESAVETAITNLFAE